MARHAEHRRLEEARARTVVPWRPQRAFPYAALVAENARRGRDEPEYEPLDTGVFDDDRYFDVLVEYAKVSPGDVLMQIRVDNRGPDPAPLHVLPTLWFHNRWTGAGPAVPRPSLRRATTPAGATAVAAFDPERGEHVLWCEGNPPLLFTDNETNTQRLFGAPSPMPYVKDGINDAVVHGRPDAVNPAGTGTKVAAHYALVVPAGGSAIERVRLRDGETPALEGHPFGTGFDAALAERRADADDFYDAVLPAALGDDARRVARQALAGLLWSKQYYCVELPAWLTEHARQRPGRRSRNWQWYHMRCRDIVAVPDTWEYPWCSAWELPFHAALLAPWPARTRAPCSTTAPARSSPRSTAGPDRGRRRRHRAAIATDGV